MSVGITGASFASLEASINKVKTRANSAFKSINKIFNTDYTNSTLFGSLDKLGTKLALVNARSSQLSNTLKALSKANIKIGHSGGGGSGRGSGGSGTRGDGQKQGRQRDPDVTVRTNAMVQARVRRAAEKQESDYQKLKSYYKKLEQKDADKAIRQEQREREKAEKKLLREAEKKQADFEKLKNSYRRQEQKDREAFHEEEKKWWARLAQARNEEYLAQKKMGKAVSDSAEKVRKSATNQGLLGLLVSKRQKMFFQKMALEEVFRFKTGMKSGGAGSSWIGKFGNPGDMPLYSRFRVFQRPFPGSERNPFALGDTGNLLNNAIYGTFSGAKAAFTGITSLGSDVARAFSGIAQVSLSAVSSIAKLGGTAGKVVSALTEVIGFVTEAGLKIFDSLSIAVGHTITAMGTLALGLSGFAYRAVQAASNLTELKNAASVYVGQVGGRSLLNTSMQYQEQFGLSASDSLRLMTRIAGQYRQTTGAGSDDAAKQAETIFKAVADAGSVLNMNLDDMGKTVQSALAGRYTPLRRIGVAVSAPYLDAVAGQMGFAKNAKTPFEARTKALIYEIGRQTKPFIGDLQATQYEFANQQRKLMGQLEAIFTHVGRALEPFAKLLVIATNNLLKLFVDKIKVFADEVETAVENLRKGIRGGWIEESLMKFAQSIAAGADFAMQFAKTVFDARWVILEKAQEFTTAMIGLGKALLSMSMAMISLAAEMARKFAPNATRDDNRVLREFGKAKGISEEKLGIKAAPQRDGIGGLVDNMDDAVKGLADLIFNIDEIAKKAKDKVNNQPNAPFFQELLKNFMARRIGAPPDFAEPVQIGQKAGALSQFFKPEAYRDEVQTRQVNAAEETAQNTRATVEVLNAIAGNIALAGMKNPINPGLAIAGGIAAP